MNLTATITKTNRWNGMMMVQLRKEINLLSKERIRHSKASEEYVDVVFNYGGVEWRGWVPIEYRRTGISIQTDEELYEYLNNLTSPLASLVNGILGHSPLALLDSSR